MIINPFIFSILIFISPYIISKLFKLNNYQGYLFGLFSFLASLGCVVGLSIVFYFIFFMLSYVFSIENEVLFLIIYILIVVGILICIYYFHLKFIKKIKDENINAVIFMYLLGYFLVTIIIAFFSQFFINQLKNLSLPQNMYKILNSITGFLILSPEYNYFMNFGICICIFFYLKQNNKILFYISFGTHSGQLITLIIAIIERILKSKIMEVILITIAILFPLFSLIIGIYVYIKYRQANNLESVKELGDTTDGNLV